MRKKVVLLILPLIFSISCEDKKSEKPGLITEISQKWIDEEAIISKSIEAVGLTYQQNYKTFASKKPINACEPQQVAALRDSEQKIAEIEKALTAEADLYRDNALEFFRKVQAYKKSLSEINSLLQPYCEQDHKTAKTCFGSENPILTYINIHITGHMVVHPLIIIDLDKEAAFYQISKDGEDEEDYIRSINLKNEKELKRYDVLLPQITTVAHLNSVFTCLSDANLKTDMAQKIKSTARVAFALGRKECLILKGNIEHTKRKSKEDNINYIIPDYIQERKFCGELLDMQ